MSAASRLELRVGMLIVAGLAAVVVLILAADRFSWDGTYAVTVYLDNASGLSQGTPVTLSGIRVGKIQAIRTVTDKRGAVELRLSINERYQLPSDVQLHVASSGIFGDSFLEFTGTGRDTKTSLPTDGTAVVVASPGFFDKATNQALAVMDAINDLLAPQTRGDVKRLVAGAADLAQESAALVKDLRGQSGDIKGDVRGAIAGVQDLTASLRETSERLGARVGTSLDGLDHAVADLDRHAGELTASAHAITGVAVDTLTSVRGAADASTALMRDERAQVHDTLAAVADISRRGADLVAALQAGHGVVGQLLVNQDLAKDLNESAINLNLASHVILEHPEALIFGNSTKNLVTLQARRDRMRLRRAFQEGYYLTPPVQVVEPMRVAQPAPDTVTR